jgi:CubicO group peptidase (beta-lactamase class C family)
MKRSAIIFVFVLHSLLPKAQYTATSSPSVATSTPSVPSMNDIRDAFNLIDKWMSAQRDFDRLPGISIAIVMDQMTVWSKAYGYADMDKKIPMQPKTICSICSISKLFTSVAVMQLVEQGKIHLDDSINALLPSFNLAQQYASSGPITIRSLLTHSSGLPRESDFPYWSGPDYNFPTEQQVKDQLGHQQTLYPASTYFQYSNLGMSILGEMVEHVSGMPYEQYVEENILKPLRLADTHPSLPEKLWGDQMATGYNSIHRDGHRDKMPLFQAKGIAPAAGFSSNVQDLARFASWQFRLLNSGGKEIIRASTLKDMQRVQFLDPDWKTAYGLGFAVREFNGTTLVGHGGSCPGYLTSILMNPKQKMAVIVMINAQGESTAKYTNAIFSILYKMGSPENKMGSSDKTTVDKTTAKDSLDLDAYTGNYESYTFGSEILVFTWKGKLAMIDLRSADPAGAMAMLKYIRPGSFRRIRSDETLAEEISFEKDKQGNVTRLWENSNFHVKL